MVTYHTIYAAPWVFAPVALYGFDILLRMLRHRVKDAILVPVDNQMTLVRVIVILGDLWFLFEPDSRPSCHKRLDRWSTCSPPRFLRREIF